MPRSLDKWFNQIITDAKRKRIRANVNQQINQSESIRKGIHRVPSASETSEAVKPLHHYVFCTHNIPYWRTCIKCGRDRVGAQRNAVMILQRSGNLKT